MSRTGWNRTRTPLPHRSISLVLANSPSEKLACIGLQAWRFPRSTNKTTLKHPIAHHSHSPVAGVGGGAGGGRGCWFFLSRQESLLFSLELNNPLSRHYPEIKRPWKFLVLKLSLLQKGIHHLSIIATHKLRLFIQVSEIQFLMDCFLTWPDCEVFCSCVQL